MTTTASVIVPVYNHDEFVERAVRSVATQANEEIEIICIDDGSHDASVHRLLELAGCSNSDIRVIPQRNAGAHAALNRGASLARGALLMFLNSDDLFGPHRVNTFVRSWERLGRPSCFWGFSAVSFVDENDDPMDPGSLDLAHLSEYTRFVSDSPWSEQLLSFRNVALTSGNLVISRELFDKTSGFQPYNWVHDWSMTLQCLVYAKPVVVQEPHYCYRIHGKNTFRTLEEEIGLRESREVRDNFARVCRERMKTQSVLRTMSPGLDYLQMTYDLLAPRSY